MLFMQPFYDWTLFLSTSRKNGSRYAVITMVRVQISLDPDTYQQAKREAKRWGISFTELVRRSLAQTLPARGEVRPWMRFGGAVESGDPSSSTTVDDVAYGREEP
jgi:hypothetical protein